MTTINGQLWQRCVECETLVPASSRNHGGLCLVCAPPAVQPPQEGPADTLEIAADDAGEMNPELDA